MRAIVMQMRGGPEGWLELAVLILNLCINASPLPQWAVMGVVAGAGVGAGSRVMRSPR